MLVLTVILVDSFLQGLFYKMCLVEARKLNRNVDTKSCVVELLVLSGGRYSNFDIVIFFR